MSRTPTPRSIRKLLENFHLDSTQTGTSPGWHEKSAAHWLQACRDAANPGVLKTAELGGSADTPFEQAFANLAHAYLRDKAPKLLEYEVGFQLVEKNQENTKAVGVFGFKVADQWLYAPVFFLNGDLKGHELLYIKQQDVFVPLKDNWLNYLLGRKPSILGQSVTKDLSQAGVLPPDLYRLTRSPYKYASAAPPMARWFREFLPDLGYLTTTRTDRLEKYASVAGPVEALRAMGRDGLDFMFKVAEAYPTVFQAFARFHPGELRKLASEVGAKERAEKSASVMKQATRWSLGEEPPHKLSQPTRDNGGVASFGRDAWDSVAGYVGKHHRHTPYDRYVRKQGSILGRLKQAKAPKAPEGRVEVILREDVWNDNAPDLKLSDDEKKKVLEEGRLVRDSRPGSAVSKAYASTTSLSLQNPTETGLYDVLVKPGGFEKCLVVIGPYGRCGQETFCTVVSLEKENRWINTHPSRVWYRSAYSRSAWNEWFDGLADAEDLPTSGKSYEPGEHVLLLGRDGGGTTPFKAYEEYESGRDRGCTYQVTFDDYCSYSDEKPYFQPAARDWPTPREREHADVKTVRFTGRVGTKFRVGPTELYVPPGFKKLTVARPDKDGLEPYRSGRDPFQPGDLVDIQFALQSGLAPLKILTDETEFDINDHRMGKDAAFKHLVLDWGLSAETADSLIKLAEMTPRRWQHAHVKLAGPYLTETQRSAPGWPGERIEGDPLMGSNVPTRVTDEREQLVQDMRADPNARQLYKPQGPDPDTMRVAQQAAGSGQREVFDTAMLGSMLKAVRQDSMVDRYLGDLMKGMDRLGRIYFQFLWHGEEFEERYGKQDLPELEDGIRNAFEAVGDIILVLKRKSVEPFAEQGTDVDLGAVAN